MSNASFKDLYAQLDSAGLLNYGSNISAEMVREILGLRMPEIAPKSVFDNIALTELAAIDYVRNILLGHGKYIAGSNGGYRVLLPSENKKQVDLYIQSADRKLRRALKLSRSSPKESSISVDNTKARIVMKRESIRNSV